MLASGAGAWAPWRSATRLARAARGVGRAFDSASALPIHGVKDCHSRHENAPRLVEAGASVRSPCHPGHRSLNLCDADGSAVGTVPPVHGMTSSPIELRHALAQDVRVSEDTLVVDLADGRTLSVPLAWYPRLAHGTPAERAEWRLIGRGEGIHWPELDEDVSVEGLLAGRRSGESQASLQRWLQSRKAAG